MYMELETYGGFKLTLKLHHISGVNRTMLLWMDKCEDLLIYHMHINGVYCISNSDHNSMKQGNLNMTNKIEMDRVIEDSKKRFL